MYYNKLLNNNIDNPKTYWDIVNNVRGTKSKERILEIKVNGKAMTAKGNESTVCEIFNNHFNQLPIKLLANSGLPQYQVAEDVSKNDDNSTLPEIKTDTGKAYKTKLSSFQLTVSDVEQSIMKLKNKKSCGADGILSTTVKRSPKFFSKILTPLINLSLRQGKFPEVLKEAIIVPVYKSGKKDDVKNYRPISILSTISKILEICVKEKLMNYLEHIKFFAPNQFGFLKSKSTDTALFKHITDITESIEQNQATLGIYLDLAKAFDTINHTKLITKLKNIGIRDQFLSWLTTYLKFRKHRVKINNVCSNQLTTEYGVPQGSVLGPLLFVIYMNDLYSLPLKAEIITFADDTSLLYSGQTKDTVQTDFDHDQQILLPWFKNNQLHLNADKCKCMVFAYKTPEWANTIQLKTDKGEFERVKEIKYLGLVIDEKLTWKKHSLYMQSKLRKQNYLFYHLKSYFNSWHLQKLYTSLYESVFSYGIIHWGASAHIKPIKVLQNKVCRTILSLNRRTSEEEIYPKMNKMKLEQLHRYRLMMFLFKNKELFQLHNTKSITRRGKTVQATQLKWRKEHSRMQARYQGVKLFNFLPADVRSEKRLSIFKNSVRKNLN